MIVSKPQLTNKLLATVVHHDLIITSSTVLDTLTALGYDFKRANVVGALNRLTPQYFERIALGQYTITKENIELLDSEAFVKNGVRASELFNVVHIGEEFNTDDVMKRLSGHDSSPTRKKIAALLYRMVSAGKLNRVSDGVYMRINLSPKTPLSSPSNPANNSFTKLINRM